MEFEETLLSTTTGGGKTSMLKDPGPLSIPDLCQLYCRSFGLWQLRTFLIVALVKIPSAWQMASILFIAATPTDFKCSGDDLDVNRTDWSVGNFVLSEQEDKSCFINLEHTAGMANNTVRCRDFDYAQDVTSDTIITRWNLVCDRSVLVNVSQFFYLFGILVGGAICTKCLPRFGPRNLLILGMIVQIISGVLVAYSPYFELQTFLRFVVACACCNMFTSGYVICTDITFNTSKTVISCCYEHLWSVGVMTLALFSYLLPHWQELQLAISLPTLFVLLLTRWIPESPKWLLQQGRMKEAKKVLQNAARVNFITSLPSELPKCVTNSVDIIPSVSETIKRIGWIKSSALHVTWACTIVTYYGALLNVRNLGPHIYHNTAIAGLAEIAGVLLGLFIILNLPRKWLCLGLTNIIGGITCCLCWTLPEHLDESSLEFLMVGLGMVGRIAIATSLTLLQVSSAELTPASLTNTFTFSCVTFARVFLLSAPFIGSLSMYGNNASLTAFGGITILGGIASVILDFFSIRPDRPIKINA